MTKPSYSWAVLEGGPHNMREIQMVDDTDMLRMPEPRDGAPFRAGPHDRPTESPIHIYRRALYRPRVLTYQGIEP